ncbi:hypothetical protein IWZ01DRAFT_493779 [Phyllosticta capitalensis]
MVYWSKLMCRLRGICLAVGNARFFAEVLDSPLPFVSLIFLFFICCIIRLSILRKKTPFLIIAVKSFDACLELVSCTGGRQTAGPNARGLDPVSICRTAWSFLFFFFLFFAPCSA